MTKVKIMSKGGPNLWFCLVDAIDYDGQANHKLEIVGLSDDETAGLVSGATYMTAAGAPIIGHTIDVTGLAGKTFDTPADKIGGGISSRVVGARTVLGVRVVSRDGANPYTQAQLIDNIYGRR
jgi:hypothetical protein